MRILGVDHGEKRIGLALSDPEQKLASPLEVVIHISRMLDASRVAAVAAEHGAGMIVVGQSFDDDDNPNPAGRRAARFAEALKERTQLPVIMWDEAFSTQDARRAQIEAGAPRSRRAGHLDALAAVHMLQSYLDSLARISAP